MINAWIVTGDTHGDMSRFYNLHDDDPSTLGIIILGDAGCNYYKNKKDNKTKQILEDTGYSYFLVRGNHEDRPENVEGMITVYNEDIQGEVFWEENFPHIFYLKDGGIYNFGGYKTLVIGGAYSVDKYYRITMGYQWFSSEQLTTDEMEKISAENFGQSFDFILSHTCPISWEPTDLFLNMIDQSTVDKSMELWLEEFKNEIQWNVWLFGHYHADRLERPHVEMFFKDMEDLDTIWKRWKQYDEDESLSWWLRKSPQFYWGE